MGIRPEGMERWGSASIFKESARLLRKHYRLFLPFYLAFYLPLSIFSVFQPLFSSLSSTPLPVNSTVEGSVNTTQTIDPLTTINAWILVAELFLFALTKAVGTLGAGAVFYITGYLYTPTRDDDDCFTFPKVFKFLPHAFLRMFITQLWLALAFFVPFFISFSASFLYVSTLTDPGWSHPIFYFGALFCRYLFLAATVYCTIVFTLAPVIAVLEPGNYGREALKRSTKLVRNGRVWTIVVVLLTKNLLSVVLSFPKNGIMTAGTPVWEKIVFKVVIAGLNAVFKVVSAVVLSFPENGIMTAGTPVWAKVVLGVVIGGLQAVFSVYSGVVLVVMYFVYKARFDVAAGSAGIPVFKRIDSAERLLDPTAEGKGSVTYVAEP